MKVFLCILLSFLATGVAEARHHHRSHHHRHSASHHTRHFSTHDRHHSTSLAALPAPLASKISEIVGSCGSSVVALNAGHSTYVAGTGRVSLHHMNRAADVAGNPGCIYSHLKNWSGGYSVDYGSVRHVHISWWPGGREWGSRFRHGGGGRRYARHHYRQRYARW